MGVLAHLLSRVVILCILLSITFQNQSNFLNVWKRKAGRQKVILRILLRIWYVFILVLFIIWYLLVKNATILHSMRHLGLFCLSLFLRFIKRIFLRNFRCRLWVKRLESAKMMRLILIDGGNLGRWLRIIILVFVFFI